jgi:hypothetical protein
VGTGKVKIVPGSGTELNSDKVLWGRAKRKAITDFIEWTLEPEVFDWINEDLDLSLGGF